LTIFWRAGMSLLMSDPESTPPPKAVPNSMSPAEFAALGPEEQRKAVNAAARDPEVFRKVREAEEQEDAAREARLAKLQSRD